MGLGGSHGRAAPHEPANSGKPKQPNGWMTLSTMGPSWHRTGDEDRGQGCVYRLRPRRTDYECPAASFGTWLSSQQQLTHEAIRRALD